MHGASTWNCVIRAAVALGAALAALDAAAQPVPVRIYPLTGDGVGAVSMSDLHSLLESAVATAARKSELVPAKPLLISASCGRAPAPDCLAGLAHGGIVVTGTVSRAGTILMVSLSAVDSDARVHGPVEVAVDTFAQSAQPLARALLEIDRTLPVEGAPAERVPAERSAAFAAPVRRTWEPRYKDTPPVPGLWRRAAGKWITGAGIALLAGGGAVAVLNKGLAEDLDHRYLANELTAADAAMYDRVDTYNLLSAALLAAGGTASCVGLYLWGTAPEVRPTRDGASFGVRGRF